MAGEIVRVRRSALSASIGLLNEVTTPFVRFQIRWDGMSIRARKRVDGYHSKRIQLRLRLLEKHKALPGQ